MSNAYIKYIDLLADEHHVWTEREIISFRKAIGHCGLKNKSLRKNLIAQFWTAVDKFDGFRITSEQSRKGTEYLLTKSLKKNGERRKGCKLGAREIEVLQSINYHKLVGLYEQYNGSGEIMGYLPLYLAVSTIGDTFEYTGTMYDQITITG